MKLFANIAAGVMLAAALVGFSASAQASDETRLLSHVSATVDDLKGDRFFGDARNAMRHARAVLIIPSLVKGGFGIGAEGGDGVMMARTGGTWSSPAFYHLGSVSIGLQIGLEEAQLVMIIMTDRALRAVERSKFKFGAGAGLTVITLGAGAEGATSGNLSGDIIVWSKAKGAYGGITLNGSVLAPDSSANRRFYGRGAHVQDILDSRVSNPDAAPLRQKMNRAF